eukprot:c9254_g1_i1.p1 GENE.c9254_g1_i1~~c9254_g1_i1.p1  ORF type:complete len:465 (-),score=104.20 c9254_g1_i1:43-1437(-)
MLDEAQELRQRATELRNSQEQSAERPVLLCGGFDPSGISTKPLTHLSQVLAGCCCPELLDDPSTSAVFPTDVVQKVRNILGGLPCGVIGGYPDTGGYTFVRERVAKYLEIRDGVGANPEDIILTSGESSGLDEILKVLLAHSKTAVLVPWPLLTLEAQVKKYGGKALRYPLDVNRYWNLDFSVLEDIIQRNRDSGFDVRVICVVHPANAGQQGNFCDELIRICEQYDLLLLIFESIPFLPSVLEQNSFNPFSYTPLRKVLIETGSSVPMISSHSIPKELFGVLQGGYVELVLNQETSEIRRQILKMISMDQSSIYGQISLNCVVDPPTPGQPSFEIFAREIKENLERYHQHVMLTFKELNTQDGLVQCVQIPGANVCLPMIRVPNSFLEQSRTTGQPLSVLFAKRLLEAKGICVDPVPDIGSLLGQSQIQTNECFVSFSLLMETGRLTRVLRSIVDVHGEIWKS